MEWANTSCLFVLRHWVLLRPLPPGAWRTPQVPPRPLSAACRGLVAKDLAQRFSSPLASETPSGAPNSHDEEHVDGDGEPSGMSLVPADNNNTHVAARMAS